MASGRIKLAGLLAAVFALGVGCAQWPKNGFLDPSQVGRFSGPSTLQNIQSVVSIKDEPLDIEAAREPAPEDLQADQKDYQLGPGDTVNVVIYELLAEGTESPFLRQISETGYVSLPELGPIKLGGLSFREAEQHVADLLQQADILRNPRVSVLVIEKRHQNFAMLGAFVRPGTYQIPKPDFRLLDALSMAGDIQPGIETIYVIRSNVQPEPTQNQTAGQTSSTAPADTAEPTLPGTTDGGIPADSGLSQGATSDTATPPATQPLPTASEMQDIMSTETEPTPSVIAPTQQRKLIAVGDQWIEVPATPQTAPATMATAEPVLEPAPATEPTVAESAQTTQAADWLDAVTEASRQRILRIPVRELMHGNPRYNVVIRPEDKVYAWLGPVGEFYVFGNVYRPGVFSLTGRRVTVRQAVIAAGGLSPLAWPDRCELVRRYNDTQEEIIQLNLDAIFAGTQPDVVLKPNDVLNVGTSAVAPFMATFRNAFRMTYGFGFVYDRNFADIDSYSSKSNPADIRRVQRQTLFGSLFQ